jgi:hypothetical protein
MALTNSFVLGISVFGVMVFRSVAEALRANFEVYDASNPARILVRQSTTRGFVLALV